MAQNLLFNQADERNPNMNTETTVDLMQRTGQRYYTIGEAADMTGISVPTIRLYEREGLIVPMRKSTRHRLFDEGDLQRIRSLRKDINAGNRGIAGIRRLMGRIPCWQIKGCSEESRDHCPAYLIQDSPCWMVTRKSWLEKSDLCRNCIVYLEASSCEQVQRALQQYAGAPDPVLPPAGS
jgi:MerR family transcriptional regulator/heat shock protein HspR